MDEQDPLCLTIRVSRLQAQGYGNSTGSSHRLLSGAHLNPVTQGPEFIAHALWQRCKNRVTRSEQRTNIAVGERLCRVVQQPIPAQLSQYRAVRPCFSHPELGRSLTLGVQHPHAPFGLAGAYAPAGSSSSCNMGITPIAPGTMRTRIVGYQATPTISRLTCYGMLDDLLNKHDLGRKRGRERIARRTWEMCDN